MILLIYYILCAVLIIVASFLWIRMLHLNKTCEQILKKEKKRLIILKRMNNEQKMC